MNRNASRLKLNIGLTLFSEILRDMQDYLRQYIRFILEEKEILGEPDLSSQDERDDDKEKEEQSVVSSIAGVTTPLGTGPTYPNPPKKKRKKSPAEVNGAAFGGAKPAKNA